MFYSFQRLLSYKRFFSTAVGERGVGKTFGATELVLKEGIKLKSKAFVWVRRFDADIDEIKDDFALDMIKHNKFPNYKFDTLKNNYYATDNRTGERFVVGEFISLNTYQRKKSRPRPDVKYIVFDEFMAEDGTPYLVNEVKKFLNLVDTIVRLRDDVRVILLGNAISMVNPYFEYFKVSDLENNFTKGRDFVIENCNYEEFREARRQTRFGKSIEGTDYGDYAIDNKFVLDDLSDVVSKPRGETQVLFNLMLNGRLILVSDINGLYYFELGRDYSLRTYTFYVDDAKERGAIFLDGRSNILNNLTNMFLEGRCLFQNLSVKNELQLIVRKIKKGF